MKIKIDFLQWFCMKELEMELEEAWCKQQFRPFFTRVQKIMAFSAFDNGDRLTLLNPFCSASLTAHSLTPGYFFLLHCHPLALGMVKNAKENYGEGQNVRNFPYPFTHILFIEVECQLLWTHKRGPLSLQKLFESFKMSTHMIGQHHGDNIPLLWLKA